MAFEWAYDLSGADLIWVKLPVKDTVVLSTGEMVNLETGEADSAVAADTALVGAAIEAVDNTDDGEYVRVACSPFAVYRVTDANARYVGETIDIASGGLTLTTASQNTLIVVKASTATEPTYVTFNQTHFLT